MSSKLTELTESSPSAPPPSVLHGSGVFSRLSSPSMASSGHFDPSQTYDGFRAVEVLDPACTECLARVMSFKLTELTESSPSALPPSFLCGSGVFSQLSPPSMTSSGQFNPSQTHDGYRAVEILDPTCTECLAK
ncbi:hypothetical protein O181_114707, partial [Austropuccinia psidii MF-1]|nr:hypothetical protein [Austropuccinia psidii MF-1]